MGKKKSFLNNFIYIFSFRNSYIFLLEIFIGLYLKKFAFCRFFTGVSVGGEYSAIFAVVDEIIPKKHRGRINILLDGTWHLGSILASLISILNKYVHFDWRIYFMLGGLSATPLLYLRNKIPESPRWMI
jgi:MFS family permease